MGWLVKTLCIAPVLSLTLLPLACRAHVAPPPGPSESPEPARLEVTSQPPVEVRLVVPERVRVGEAVPLRLEVLNRGTEMVDVEVGGRPVTFDFIVTRPDGTEVWRRRRIRHYLPISRTRQLDPGEGLVYFAEWDQRDNQGNPVPPGTYYVQGYVQSDLPHDIVGPKPLIISR